MIKKDKHEAPVMNLGKRFEFSGGDEADDYGKLRGQQQILIKNTNNNEDSFNKLYHDLVKKVKM